MSENHEEFLAVLKASYDYSPQSDDEIAIKEDQILFLKEKVDDDWWKVKIKADSPEADSPVGLVPSAYVEKATYTSKVKALYDYGAAADGELSIEEDEILLVFFTEQDWILVQSQREGGRAGFVPGNYVEPYTESEAFSPPRIIVPPVAPRPVSSYVDPADRVASSKVSADGIKTWSVSEVDKKGKKKKGTLGIGNGAVFFASESDKTPVQKWQIVDVQSVTSEKVKHVMIVIGGIAPIDLHFHAGSKDNVEEIIGKLKSSQALANPSEPTDTTRNSFTQASIPEELPAPKKASVHFSHSAPDIIPVPNEEEDNDDDDETHKMASPSINSIEQPIHQNGEMEIGVALYDFTADGDDELSIREGEQLTILEREGDDWWKCRNSKDEEGVVPASYIEIADPAQGVNPIQGVDPVSKVGPQSVSPEPEEVEEAAEEERRRAEEERVLKEQEAQRAEQAKKKAEAQKRAKEAAIAAEVERQRRKEAAAARTPPSSAVDQKKSAAQGSASSNSKSRPSSENNRPPPEHTRIWHDRSGQFRVEAAFLGFNNGKLRLHKVNGVIVEVPSEKMSIEDVKFVERLISKESRPAATKQVSEDDIPLGLTRSATAATAHHSQTRSAPRKAPQIDWFDFFLSAGCDLDDCTRYAASFERDKLDEILLPDITEGTMRSLGVREGDIIRIAKAIEKRRPTDNLRKPSSHVQEQLRRDEELARQLQAQEAGGTRAAAPNLFAAGPGGALKTQTRRGRPTPSKSLPPFQVDLKAISTASDQIQRTSSPQVSSPTIAVSAPPRSSSAAPASGFDDDAWTNRPSSTKPTGTLSHRAPSAPPASITVEPLSKAQPVPAKSPVPMSASPKVAATQPVSTVPVAGPAPSSNSSSLPKAESDIFDQLSRLGELRKQSTSAQSQITSPPTMIPPSFQVGLGMGSSPTPIGQLIQNPQLNPQQLSHQPYNGPRGPFAPVPANQSLLQPLIPTTTGLTGMVPTRTGLPVSQFSGSSPSFLSQQPAGLPQPLMMAQTGLPSPGYGSIQNPGSASTQNQHTGFNSNFAQSPFNNSTSSLVPPLPASLPVSDNSPANIFAQMKSGTFATDNNTNAPSQPMLTAQSTGWSQPYQSGYMGFQR